MSIPPSSLDSPQHYASHQFNWIKISRTRDYTVFILRVLHA